MADSVVARESFLGPDGFVPKGAELPADDPVVRRFPELFEPAHAERARGPRVERADARPDEGRVARKPRRNRQ